MNIILEYMMNCVNYKDIEKLKEEYMTGKYKEINQCPKYAAVKAYSDTITILAREQYKLKPMVNGNSYLNTEEMIDSKMIDSKMMITPKECQKILGIGTNTMYSLLKDEEFPSIKVGAKYYINKALLQGYLNRQCEKR